MCVCVQREEIVVESKHDKSLMERLVERKKKPDHVLKLQYRMRKNICCFSNQSFYENELQTAKKVLDRPSQWYVSFLWDFRLWDFRLFAFRLFAFPSLFLRTQCPHTNTHARHTCRNDAARQPRNPLSDKCRDYMVWDTKECANTNPRYRECLPNYGGHSFVNHGEIEVVMKLLDDLNDMTARRHPVRTTVFVLSVYTAQVGMLAAVSPIRSTALFPPHAFSFPPHPLRFPHAGGGNHSCHRIPP